MLSFRRFSVAFLMLLIFSGAAFLFSLSRTETVDLRPVKPAAAGTPDGSQLPLGVAPLSTPAETSSAPHAPIGAATTTAQSAVAILTSANDLPNQPQLPNPPTIVKGIYLTNWTAGSAKRVAALIDLVDRDTELNAMVIDIKDYSGYVAYRTGIPAVAASGAERDVRILRPNTLIKQLHDKGIYIIGRVTVFQDPVLAKAHPEWAVRDKNTGGVWLDRKGIAWLDAGAEPVWSYYVALAQNALDRGFDEINFDYIRFPSDGDLSAIEYPFTDDSVPEHTTIAKFFAYLREHLSRERISADLFGLTTSSADDLGIGQKLEDALSNFGAVSPMVYPSHFASGYGGFAKPAEHPYDVIHLSMTAAVGKLERVIRQSFPVVASPPGVASSTTATSTVVHRPITPADAAPYAKIRPWLQVFNLGAVYTSARIDAQIRATGDVLGGTPYSGGWLLWDPSNRYTNYQVK